MTVNHAAKKVRVAVIGAGAVSDYHHVPALRLDPRAELVAVCDAAPALLEKRKADWGIDRVTTDPDEICAADDVDAVIIATPELHPRADRRRRRAGGQARHVREAARPERRRGPHDVRGLPRRRASST